MISPLARMLCCLLGIAAAGTPLVVFTKARPAAAPVATPQAAVATVAVEAMLRYTGDPVEICILHEGKLLSRLQPAAAEGRWYGRLDLPQPAAGDVLELEVQVVWPEPRPEGGAVTLELTPPHLPAVGDTHWAEPGEALLHNIFLYRW